jgi:hypothetical protein
VAEQFVPSDEECVRLYESGGLSAELARYREGEGDDDLFLQRCIALHNRGDIDLVALPSQAEFAALGGHPFFEVQQFYCRAIPELKTDAAALMECCGVLLEKAGADLAANLPNGAFRIWCERNPGEAANVIRDARAGDALAKRFVTFALQGTNDIDGAVSLIRTYDDDRRLSGMAALAGMSLPDLASAQRAVAVLEPYVGDRHDDHPRANALLAAFDVLKQHNDVVAARKLIDSATKHPGPGLLHSLARVVWLHHAQLDPSMLRDALPALESVNPEHLGTVREIDRGLRQLLGTKNEPFVLDFLTTILRNPKLKLESFETISHELARGDKQRLYELIVRWFLSGSIALCASASDLVGLDQERAFDTTVQSLGLAPIEQIFLCRKAIGFLFLKPVICCSIIVSVLRARNPEVKAPVADLLFDPVLVNYGGETKSYLESLATTDAAYDSVQTALSKNETFYAGLKAADTINELHPSDYRRDVVRQRDHDDMRAIQKMAESKSTLLKFVHRSTILYGRRSRTYVEDIVGGGHHPVEVGLKTFGKSWELPRHEILDPVGLDYVLRIFRVEKLK